MVRVLLVLRYEWADGPEVQTVSFTAWPGHGASAAAVHAVLARLFVLPSAIVLDADRGAWWVERGTLAAFATAEEPPCPV